MKNKFFAIVFLIVGCLVAVASRAEAQQSSVSFNKTGISVIFKVQTSAPEAVKQSFSGSVYFTSYDETEKGGRIHRVLGDSYLGAYFGYDLVIEPADAPTKYKISIKPLSITPPKELRLNDLTARSLPKYPADMIVEDGDTIALDVLVNSQTQVKIVDLIKVTTKKMQGASSFSSFTASSTSNFNPGSGSSAKSGSFAKQPTRDFTPNDVTLRLTAPKLFVNGEVGTFPGSDWSGGMIEGSVIYIYIPGRGRFVFSLFPHDNFNFRKDAAIENNKIAFRFGEERYELISKAPIMNNGGNWNLWVLNEASFKPDLAFGSASSDNVQYGAADGVEYLLGRNVQARRRLRSAPIQRDTKAVYQNWVDKDVRYLITDAEKQTFSQLGGDEEREQFIEAFWKRRDSVPETEDNEFRREYYNRIAYANQNFAVGGTAGWLTDRGRIFITHGKPDNIQKNVSGETWTYKSPAALGDNVRFEFVDNARNGDFRLRQ